MISNQFNVIIVGGGHAGIEAAYAAANMGCKVALISLDKHKLGLMPCNPSVGGVGKGHIVFEVSALGGIMPKLCTQSYLQVRMLNTKKGPAVQGLRLQIDKEKYAALASKAMQEHPLITIIETMVDEILVEDQKVVGIRTHENIIYYASSVVVTTGTFLRGLIHIGDYNYPAGRRDEKAATELSNFLLKLNLKMGRLKTGTPPRLATDSIDFSKLEKQDAHDLDFLFEFGQHTAINSRDCYIARTNESTHEIIRKNLHKSAMYSGNIKGIGPRYCPSIEDKISRFADKSSHHIFVEPETAEYVEVYPSGISTSLPADVQEQFIHSIEGFENARVVKLGYAVEYDFVHPDQLTRSLEVKTISGLFLAGQINGTTGYEEAAGQGIIAGINAALKYQGKDPFILERDESYIGIMIDDLITMGVDEPYRMFTSRAEHRLILRQDNAFLRLTPKGYQLGTVDETMYQSFLKEKEELETALAYIAKTYKHDFLVQQVEDVEDHKPVIQKLLGYTVSTRNMLSIYAELKYKEYIKRELRQIEKNNKYKTMTMPPLEVLKGMPGLSTEMQQKIIRYQPATLAQAALIPGMTPACMSK
jgi:tRNA uridine 5-carboxymethylaminomethyl modification enzyme